MAAVRALQASRTFTRIALPLHSRTFSRIGIRAPQSLARVGPSTVRAFSVTARVQDAPANLVKALQNEITFEKEAGAEQPATPEFLEEFNKQGIWKIQDASGHDEVILTRQFNNETIRVIFSIADLESEQPEFEEEAAEGEEEEPVGAIFPLRCSITVTKPSGGALHFEGLIQDGAVVVQNISFYKDAALATGLSAEADWSRRGLYIGPQFDHLDVNVQEEFDEFLAERGIDQSLAVFLPEYAEYKEQKEYTDWLQSVKKFVEA